MSYPGSLTHLAAPDMAYEGSDPTGAVWVTACGRGRFRCVALFGGWRDTIGADLGNAVRAALRQAQEARRQALRATPHLAEATADPDPADDDALTGTSPYGWVTVTTRTSGEVIDIQIEPALLQANDVAVMREVTGAFRAAYAAARS